MPRWPRSRRGRRRPVPNAGACCGAPPTSPAAASTKSRERSRAKRARFSKEAKGEVLKGISLLEYYAGEGFRMHGKTLPSESRDTFTYTLRQPLGCVGLIAPWNFPWAIPVWKSAPAIVAGNAVVLQAGGAHAGHVRAAGRDLRGGRPAARCVQHGGRPRLATSVRRWSRRRSCARFPLPGRTTWATRSTSRRRSAAPR